VKGYRTTEVSEMTGVSFRQLDYWDRTGSVHPSILSAVGIGFPRLYSDADVAKVRIIRRLLDLGITLERIRRDGDPRLTVLNLLIELSDPELHREPAA
jgi:DNA-binding transcriptional MerR regulator